MDTTQANICWKQIPVMTKMACGARQPSLTPKGTLQCKLGGRQRFLDIALNGRDLYDVTAFRVKRGSYEKVVLETAEDVFVDELGETIYHMVNK